MPEINNLTTPILRLREFVQWAQMQGLCKSEYDFSRICGLSERYIANCVQSSKQNSKGNIGAEILGRIVRKFPQLNLVWLCTGDGPMLVQDGGRFDPDYKQAYEGALMQIEALNRIINQLNK